MKRDASGIQPYANRSEMNNLSRSDPSSSLPEFPEIDLQGKPLPEGILPEHIQAYQQLYREHSEVKNTSM